MAAEKLTICPDVTNQVPAILETINGQPVKSPPNFPTFVYSRETLMKLRGHSLSKHRPKYLDPAFVVAKDGMWDPELWMSSNPSKRSEDEKRNEREQTLQAPSESDDYCFTPQRRSFVAGCHVTPARRAEIEIVEKEKEPAPRRVGSGRVMIRDSEIPQKEREGRREGPAVGRGEPVLRGDRQLNRDPRGYREKGPLVKENRRPYENDYGRNNRVNGSTDRRKYHDETPEWFSGGPTSQNETIELKGFDENSNTSRKKREAKEELPKEAKNKEKKDEEHVNRGETKKETKDLTQKEEEKTSVPSFKEKDSDFNIEQFLNMDDIGLNLKDFDLGFSGGEPQETQSQGSRFSRWFKSDSEPQPQKEAIVEKTQLQDKEDAAKSLLQLLQNGGIEPKQQPQHLNLNGIPAVLNGIPTAEEVERMAGRKAAFNPTAVPAQDKIQPPPQDALTKFLQQQEQQAQHQMQPHQVHQQQQQLHHQMQQQQVHHQMQQPVLPFQVPLELQQRPEVQALMRDMALGRIGRQQASQQLELIALHHFQQKQVAPPKPASTSSPLAFTPTAVMRKMTADKEKEKMNKLQDKGPEVNGDHRSAPSAAAAASSGATSTRLTGRTASQVQGADRVSSQLGLHASHQLPKTDVAMNQQHPGMQVFGSQYSSSAAAMTDIALRLLEQQKQQQQQLLSAPQNQFKHQQFQSTSPLPQPLLPMQGRGVNQQMPPVPMNGPGFAPFMAGVNAAVSQGNRGGMNSVYSMPQMGAMQGPARSMNSMMQMRPGQSFNGNRSPVLQQGSNPLARWYPSDLSMQAPNPSPALTNMANQKMSLEELERILAAPMPH